MLNSLRFELIGFSLFPSKLSRGRGRREIHATRERKLASPYMVVATVMRRSEYNNNNNNNNFKDSDISHNI